VHFEIVEQGDLEAALDTIAASDFRAIAVNGGDGTVQGVLTRLFGEDAPARAVPPVAVLPASLPPHAAIPRPTISVAPRTAGRRQPRVMTRRRRPAERVSAFLLSSDTSVPPSPLCSAPRPRRGRNVDPSGWTGRADRAAAPQRRQRPPDSRLVPPAIS
jgi:hypothetical protein